MSKQISGFFPKKKVVFTALHLSGLVVACEIALGQISLASPPMPPPPPYSQFFHRGIVPPPSMPGGFQPNRQGFNPGVSQLGTRAAKPAKPTTKAADEIVELQHSNPMIGQAGSWQSWSNVIYIAPGLEKMPLFFNLENGADGTPKFQDLKVLLNRKPFLTIKDFNGSTTCSRNLMGTLGPGNAELIVQGIGPTGAKMIWRLSTNKLVISGVKPNAFSLTDKVTIEGTNLPTNAAYIKVFIANKPVPVVSVQAPVANGQPPAANGRPPVAKAQPKTELQLKLPDDLPGGKQDLIAVVGPLKSNVIQVTVKAAPHVYSVNFVSTAPGQPVVISGKGFSTTASENTVTIGGAGATVTSATATSLTCTVSVDLPAPQWYAPIIVTTNGQPSTEKVTINLGQRVIPNDGSPEQ
jgi:IPT/TIG domain